MLAKTSYVIAIALLVIGLIDAFGGAHGSERQIEAGLCIIAAPLFALIGLWSTRSSTKACQACRERIKRDATKCRYCGTDLPQAS